MIKSSDFNIYKEHFNVNDSGGLLVTTFKLDSTRERVKKRKPYNKGRIHIISSEAGEKDSNTVAVFDGIYIVELNKKGSSSEQFGVKPE